MRTLLVIAATLLIAQYGNAQPAGRGGGGGRGAGGGRGQQAATPAPPPDPGFECFDHAETPEFPPSALQARVDGTVYIWVHLTPQATVDKIDNQVASSWKDGPMLLTPAVEKAVRASKFKSDCASKTVAVVYRYDLVGAPVASPKPETKTESNIMYISSPPANKAAAAKSAPPAK
jgi:hypothetical protein